MHSQRMHNCATRFACIACLGLAAGVASLAVAAEAEPEAAEKAAATVPGTLDPAVIDKAKELCPDLLELRLESDELYRTYHELAHSRGVRKRKEAEKELPGVMSNLEKTLKKLDALFTNAMQPQDRLRDRYTKEEGKLLDRLAKLDEQGRDPGKTGKQADEIAAQLRDLEDYTEVLREVGQPVYVIVPPQYAIIKSIAKPSLTQESELKKLQRNHPDFFAGRIVIENLLADLQAETQAGGAADRLRKLEKQLANTQEKFADLAEDVLEECRKTRTDLEKDMEKLMPRVDRTMGKRSGRKYQEQLSKLQRQLDTNRTAERLLRNLCKGTHAEALFQEAGKQDEAPEKDGKHRR